HRRGGGRARAAASGPRRGPPPHEPSRLRAFLHRWHPPGARGAGRAHLPDGRRLLARSGSAARSARRRRARGHRHRIAVRRGRRGHQAMAAGRARKSGAAGGALSPFVLWFEDFYMSASPAAKPAGLSVFFPAYNDSGTIASMVIRTVKAASELTPDFEIIVVDDGSADGTADIADELARTYPQVRAVHHPINRDYGAALQTGFRSATKELIFYTDGDAQYDPAELSLLWSKMTADADLVNGYKISRSDPLHRILIGRIYHHIVSLLFGLKLRDVDCDFRLLRRTLFERLNPEQT